MIRIEVRGFDCSAGLKSHQRLQQLAVQLDRSISVSKVDYLQRFMQLQVLKPPGIAINGVLRLQGSAPSEQQLRRWIEEVGD